MTSDVRSRARDLTSFAQRNLKGNPKHVVKIRQATLLHEFGDPSAGEIINKGMKACQNVVLSPIMRKLGAEPFQTVYPGCEKYEHGGDGHFRCIAQTVLYTLSHPSGTAKMGDPRDPTTVVDPQLRVKHIHGLRVVDNSIMPAITSGNTLTPAIMIGEKASSMIKESIECLPHKKHHGDYHYGEMKHDEDGDSDSHGVDASYMYPIQPESYPDKYGKKGQPGGHSYGSTPTEGHDVYRPVNFYGKKDLKHKDGSRYESSPYEDHDDYDLEKYGKKVLLEDGRSYGSTPYEDHEGYSPEKYSKEVLRDVRFSYGSTPDEVHDDDSLEKYSKKILGEGGRSYGGANYGKHDDSPEKYSKKILHEGGYGRTSSASHDDYSPEIPYGKMFQLKGGHIYGSTPYGVRYDYSPEKQYESKLYGGYADQDDYRMKKKYEDSDQMSMVEQYPVSVVERFGPRSVWNKPVRIY